MIRALQNFNESYEESFIFDSPNHIPGSHGSLQFSTDHLRKMFFSTEVEE